MTLARFKSFQILHSESNYHFVVERGVFFCCRSSSADTKNLDSAGFFVEENQWNLSEFKKTLEGSLKKLSITNKDLIVKAVGPVQLIDKWSAHLSAHKIEKVSRDGALEYYFFPKEQRIRVAATSISSPASENHPDEENVEIRNKKRTGPVRILVVDDSKTIRMLLKGIFSNDPGLEVIADTGSPKEVVSLIEKHKPDLITLDIHMPEMDGVTLLKSYIGQYPIPTVMISSISMEEGPIVFSALEAGAVDYIKKPEMNELAENAELIIDKIKTAATVSIKQQNKIKNSGSQKKQGGSQLALDTDSFVAIGSSTGGTEALKEILTRLPASIPPIVIVQHIPPVFSKAFAKRLNDICSFTVKEAEHNDLVEKNHVYIAPGGKQMRLQKNGAQIKVEIVDAEPVNRHKPSVDYLFDSLVDFKLKKPVAMILTGMGGDGARGLLKLKQAGWTTLAQNKETCVVFGMPQVAIQLGAADHVVPLDQIAEKLQQFIPAKSSAA